MSREIIRRSSLVIGIITIIAIIFSPSIPVTIGVTVIGGGLSLIGVRIIKTMDAKPKDYNIQ
jgi:hypothetical protein